MKIADLFRRKKAHWNVFNEYTEYEFGECSKCGCEVEPDFSYYPIEVYPVRCPKCRREMTHEEAWS